MNIALKKQMLILSTCLILQGCSSFFSKPCDVKDISGAEKTFFTGEGLDYGYSISAKIVNLTSRRDFKVNFRLSTSEGDFNRSQSVVIEEKSSDMVSADFSEPTVNGTVNQVYVTCE